MGSNKKKENLLWKLDVLEAKATKDTKNTRLVRTQFAVTKKLHKEKKVARQKKPYQDAFANPYRADLIAQELQDQEEENDGPVELSEEDKNRIRELRVKLVDQKIFHYSKAIRKAIKVSKTTEVLKLTKRAKNEESESKKNTYEKEKEACKSVDVETLTQAHVIRSIRKTFYSSKAQKENPPEFLNENILNLSEDSPATSFFKNAPPALELVSTRIINTKPVRSAVEQMIQAIKYATKIEHKETASEIAKRKREEQKIKRKAAKEAAKNGKPLLKDDGELDEDELQRYDNMIAGSSDEGEGPELPDLDPNEVSSGDEADSESGTDDEDDLENEEQGPDDFFDFPAEESQSESELEKSTEKKSKKEKKKKENDKIVLPALASGYFSGGSDDDFDPDADPLVRETVVERKNRRGQRARRAIAEAKFGKNANHIKKQREEEAEKRLKKQAEFEKREARRREKGIQNTNQEAIQRPEKRKTPDDDKPIHPSWEAKKKLSAAPVEFKGKKIVF